MKIKFSAKKVFSRFGNWIWILIFYAMHFNSNFYLWEMRFSSFEMLSLSRLWMKHLRMLSVGEYGSDGKKIWFKRFEMKFLISW